MPNKRPTTRQKYAGKAQPANDTRTDNRESAAKRGYGRMHRRWRQMVLHRHPLCTRCHRAPATIADHVIPWQDGGPKYALDNGTGLCLPCHNAKTHEDVARRKAGGA